MTRYAIQFWSGAVNLTLIEWLGRDIFGSSACYDTLQQCAVYHEWSSASFIIQLNLPCWWFLSNYFGKWLNYSGNMITTHFEFEKIVGQSGSPLFSFSRKGHFLSNEVLRSYAGFNKVRFSLLHFLIFRLGCECICQWSTLPHSWILHFSRHCRQQSLLSHLGFAPNQTAYHRGSVTVVWMLT